MIAGEARLVKQGRRKSDYRDITVNFDEKGIATGRWWSNHASCANFTSLSDSILVHFIPTTWQSLRLTCTS
jgi:hypothetical protein